MTLFLLILVAILIYYFFIYKDSPNSKASNERNKCPNCGSSVEENFNICPICKETLKKKCSNCGRMVDALWNFCPYCEKPISKGGNR